MIYKVLKNFLEPSVLGSISSYKGFNPFKARWYDAPIEREYQKNILEEASSFVELDRLVGIEEWFHNPAFLHLPGKHYDKDEYLYERDGTLDFPLCSCVLYMKVEDLVGARLIIEDSFEVVPESNTLVLMKPGTLHEVTEYVSGTRTSVNINPWSRPLKIS